MTGAFLWLPGEIQSPQTGLGLGLQVVSSCPQIRFPDVYGIDMAKLGDLAAFKAAIGLLKDPGELDGLQVKSPVWGFNIMDLS